MKIYIIIAAGLISFTAHGQETNLDSLFYTLTLRTIEDHNEIRVFKTVTTPTLFWNIKEKKPLLGNCFEESDLEFISDQVTNPIITKWDAETFRKNKNIKLVNKSKNKECIFVSLPIISKDLKTIAIYYESWNKPFLSKESSGAGFVVVWRRTLSNTWTRDKEKMLWITDVKAPSPTTACMSNGLHSTIRFGFHWLILAATVDIEYKSRPLIINV